MKLMDYLKRQGWNDSYFAEKIGVSKKYVNKIKRGEWLPSKKMVEKIKRATNGEVANPSDFRTIKKIYLVLVDNKIMSIWEDAHAAVENSPRRAVIISANINTIEPEIEIH